ncbi:Armadillo-type fold [Prunus yedoensis var. nudiflora]|uniref:Armadillo-type fold n=1 Tax=Prunus yedoensis var. nudiflora TaxID=2094558 RepID=A0A314YYV2_PRUYE|nr:Armadillo-type fold [Prunus yedoensis var. nudiflora]
MAAANAPITMKEALTLPSVGINPQFITFTHVTMESDKYICVRETSPQNSIVIIDMSMPMQPLRRPITADSALMNPNSKILALKGMRPQLVKGNLQLFSVDQQRSQALEAHAASFAQYKTLNAGQITSKLHVIELGAQPGKPSFTKETSRSVLSSDFADDFPVAMQFKQFGACCQSGQRGNLPGCPAFPRTVCQTKYKEAAELAAESPQGILRTPDTVAKFQSVPVQTGQTPPLLQYFGTLLTRGSSMRSSHWNYHSCSEPEQKKTLENWLAEDKLECSEELGDLVKVGYTPDYLFLLQTILRADPQGAVNFALMMSQMEGGCPVDYNTITDLFLQVNPGNAPLVVGQLLDDECPEDFIKGLILSVRSLLPVEPLVEECEKRNRLRLLTQFLEHLVSEGSQDVHVHNALAIKADPSRVMDYINRLDNFDGPAVGEVAVEAQLYEEAFAIFKKFNLNVQAVNVLLDNIRSIDRAVEFAFRVEEDAVWSQVAKAQLREGLVSDAIESFIRADDATQFLDVIVASEDADVYHDLVRLPSDG